MTWFSAPTGDLTAIATNPGSVTIAFGVAGVDVPLVTYQMVSVELSTLGKWVS